MGSKILSPITLNICPIELIPATLYREKPTNPPMKDDPSEIIAKNKEKPYSIAVDRWKKLGLKRFVTI